MINHRAFVIPILFILMAGILSSCSGSDQSIDAYSDQVRAGVSATQTKEAFIISIDNARETDAAKKIETETPEASPTIEFTETPPASPTPKPIFRLKPGSPPNVHMYIIDMVSVDSAKNKTTLGDNYAWGRLERPFTSRTMQYRNYLDIYQANLVMTETWVYITIILIGNLPDEGDIYYSVELDIDHNGRGDFLLAAELPPDDEWTTENVTIYADADEDIGGVYPMYMEGPVQSQTGYEKVIFKDKFGDDWDLAWVRREPDHRNQIQLAFKNNLIGTSGFLWNIWTDEGLKNPSYYDFNDHFTFDEAGSPNKDNYRYPLKAVALVDSTCRAWYGYVPSGFEPGLCFTGEQVIKNRPGYGWCEPDPIYSGCGNNPCLTYCPGKRFCIPCSLP